MPARMAWLQNHARNVSAALLAVLLLASCGGGGGGDASTSPLPPPPATPLAISPTTVVMAVGTTQQLQATGGQGAYTYSLVSGGGTVDASGLYTAPTTAGSALVRVTDASNASAQSTITVNPPVALSPASISVTASSGQSYAFRAQNGGGGYTYSVLSGPGVVNASGVYTAGTQTGTSVVQVRDRHGATATAQVRSVRFRTNGIVLTAVNDGASWYLGGFFNAVNPYVASRLIALDTATGDPLLGCDVRDGFDGGRVHAVLIVGNALYVGGTFNTYQGQPARRLAKLDATSCALDTTFTQAAGFDGTLAVFPDPGVTALAASNGALYVGGNFTGYRGQPANGLAKLDAATGALDTTFTQATGANGSVAALAVNSTSVFVGGYFDQYRGTNSPRLAKVDALTGNLDPTFGRTLFVSGGSVLALVATDQAVFVGGANIGPVRKLDASTGAPDASFAQEPAGSQFPQFNALLLSGDSLYAGGSFVDYRGVPAQSLVKLNAATGAVDPAFTSVMGGGTFVQALTITGSSLYAGGFLQTGSLGSQALAKLDTNTGALDTTFTRPVSFAGDTENVSSLAASGSSVYVGGGFSSYRGAPANNIAKIRMATDEPDPAFDSGAGFDSTVQKLALSGSALFVGGSFDHYKSTSVTSLAKLDATTAALDTTFTQATGIGALPPVAFPSHASVSAIVVAEPSVYVSGYFRTWRGAPAHGVAKLDTTTGNLDTTFTQSPGFVTFSNPPFTIAGVGTLLKEGASLYAGGSFSQYGVSSVANLARLDATSGTLDTSFTPLGFLIPANLSYVTALQRSGASLFIGGGMLAVNGNVAYGLAKVNATTGAVDPAFDITSGFVDVGGFNGGAISTLQVLGSSLYVGGRFSTYQNSSINNLAKLDVTTGALDPTFTDAVGPNGLVSFIESVDGTLYVGGGFDRYRGSPTGSFMKLDPVTGALLD